MQSTETQAHFFTRRTIKGKVQRQKTLNSYMVKMCH